MIQKKFKSGISTIVLLITMIVVASCWPTGKEQPAREQEKRRIVVTYELGTREILIDDYIAGVIGSFEKWADLDKENAEMVKVLAILVRSNIAYVMQEQYVIEAEKLPFKYDGGNSLVKNYGSGAAKKIAFINENVKATSGFIMKDESGFAYCGYYESTRALKGQNDTGLSLATAREMTRQGKNYEEVLKEFFENFTMVINFN